MIASAFTSQSFISVKTGYGFLCCLLCQFRQLSVLRHPLQLYLLSSDPCGRYILTLLCLSFYPPFFKRADQMTCPFLSLFPIISCLYIFFTGVYVLINKHISALKNYATTLNPASFNACLRTSL